MPNLKVLVIGYEIDSSKPLRSALKKALKNENIDFTYAKPGKFDDFVAPDVCVYYVKQGCTSGLSMLTQFFEGTLATQAQNTPLLVVTISEKAPKKAPSAHFKDADEFFKTQLKATVASMQHRLLKLDDQQLKNLLPVINEIAKGEKPQHTFVDPVAQANRIRDEEIARQLAELSL